MLDFFKKPEKRRAEPAAPTGQELLFKVGLLELRILNLEECIMKLCQGLRLQIDRLDHQDRTLLDSMHRLVSMAIRPPKDLLGGNKEPN